MTRLRGIRSAITPPTRRKKICGRIASARTKPSSVADAAELEHGEREGDGGHRRAGERDDAAEEEEPEVPLSKRSEHA